MGIFNPSSESVNLKHVAVGNGAQVNPDGSGEVPSRPPRRDRGHQDRAVPEPQDEAAEAGDTGGLISNTGSGSVNIGNAIVNGRRSGRVRL